MSLSKLAIWLGVLVIAIGFFVGDLSAQVSGRIVGRVTDSSTGNYLPGANVMIKGTNMGAATGRQGEFVISNVPPGSYTLVVSYIGYEEFSTSVSVTVGGTTRQDVALKVSYVEMEQVVVEGIRQGQVKALSQQRTSATIQNVVAQEMIERFPDENTADVLKRIPGVYIQNSLGEGRFALIRGTDPRLNIITVNGEKLATNRTEERYPQLDIIGSSQLASVEVTKALTPDMDGDAIGGSINLVTRSAFDYPGRRIDITVGSGYANIDAKPIGQGKIHFSNVFGANRKLGFSITANWDQKERGTHNTEPRWADKEDINKNKIPFALTEVTLMDYNSTFTRYGLGGSLEYRLSENHQWNLRGLYSLFRDETFRPRMRLRVDRGKYLNPEGTLTQDSRIVRDHTWRIENLYQQNYSFGGLHKFGNMTLDYTAAYSYADEKHPDQYLSEWDFDKKVNLALDLSLPEAPKWTFANIADSLQYDPTLYTLSQFDYRSTTATNTITTGAANFKMPYNLFSLPAELKLGIKANMSKKDRDEDRWRYKWTGKTKIKLNQLASDEEEKDFFNGEYEIFGPVPDQKKVADFIKAYKPDSISAELRYWDSEGQNFVANEMVYAYYAMTTVNVGKFMFLGGLRHEFTQNEYDGTQLFFNDKGAFSSMERVKAKRDYNNILPMVHLRYRLTPMTNVRLAYTHAIARPNYWDYAPYFFVDPSGKKIDAGNPDLKPTTSKNVDLMFEHYFGGIGIASGGFFYKKLDDIIYVETSKVVGGTWDGFTKEQAINGGSANLFGFELNWQQEFSFLPGFLSGFGIYANYTHTWSDAEMLGREGVLPGQAGDVANASLAYEKYGFSARLSASYRDKFIVAVGQDKPRDEWMDKHLQIDFSATYNILPWMQAYFEAINLTNEPSYKYLGERSRPLVVEYFSWWMKGGLKFRFGS
ncbi:MAG: TonB-dependent receptor [candidate division KSB1 bacterium]|nr:TonB-dependent receptor [candidate division KSB1 bacterium]MDZ7335860.1 TonB-dependent receptor [candidate division KSB1 bacterium]MDZ7358387.1 TonB-dependent receptor [candidate division KSB1 bacterium]MDZ7376275.1 TonB-dependent receptor [candidate division KSB1 bacterium]MDZ7400150.1 TonB-dependent receptor [candidate division KSB1 bacterium]